MELVGGFCWENSPYSNSDGSKFTKYVPSDKTNYWGGTGSPDNKLKLDQEDDAAFKYLGGNFRMPTSVEFQELYENTTSTWVTDYNGTGIKGRVFTSKTDTSKEVFFPATGYVWNTTLYFVNAGDYWSSSVTLGFPEYANCFYFLKSLVDPLSNGSRCYYGMTVRPVSD